MCLSLSNKSIMSAVKNNSHERVTTSSHFMKPSSLRLSVDVNCDESMIKGLEFLGF